MPWIVVLGKGSWGHNRVTYRAGKHEVPEDVALAARAANKSKLLVFEDEPEIVEGSGGGVLSPDDILLGNPGGVRLPADPEEPVPEEDNTIPYNYPCEHCVLSFPSGPARDRHVEFHHRVRR